jgi:hypothetical protein
MNVSSNLSLPLSFADKNFARFSISQIRTVLFALLALLDPTVQIIFTSNNNKAFNNSFVQKMVTELRTLTPVQRNTKEKRRLASIFSQCHVLIYNSQ